jgi:hypothetical protein
MDPSLPAIAIPEEAHKKRHYATAEQEGREGSQESSHMSSLPILITLIHLHPAYDGAGLLPWA